MAAASDYFKKIARRWTGQIGSGGVSDGTVTTIPLSSTTNLPTDTGVIVVIDRVDTNGTATPTLEETVLGVVSGNNLINCTRGAEGTAQAHNAGAVVEVLFTNKGWSDLITGLLVEHNQAGTHTNITACNITASGTTTASHITASDITGITANVCNIVGSQVTAINFTATGNVTASNVSTLTGTQTLTNKRITPRVTAITSSATPTINTDNCDMVTITALAAAITSMTTNLSGTPSNGDKLMFRIKDDGTGRAITWGASFASRGATLPTTTTANKVTYVGFIWNSVASTWDCVAALTEA